MGERSDLGAEAFAYGSLSIAIGVWILWGFAYAMLAFGGAMFIYGVTRR